MITITQDVKKFLDETQNEKRWIFGYGNCGRWFSFFMERTGYDFYGYIDSSFPQDMKETIYTQEGRYVLRHPKDLSDVERLNIIIAVGRVSAYHELMKVIDDDARIYCLVCEQGETNDINYLLSFFRNQLIDKRNIPTIISNDCSDGMIYRALGLPLLSPTVNSNISLIDMIKIANNPEKYFSEDMLFSHWSQESGIVHPVGKIKDIYINFAHENDANQAMDFWNGLRKYVNTENLIFVFEDTDGADSVTYTYELIEEFLNIKQKSLYATGRSLWAHKGVIYAPHSHFRERGIVIENWLDLVEWFNGKVSV